MNGRNIFGIFHNKKGEEDTSIAPMRLVYIILASGLAIILIIWIISANGYLK